MNFKTLMTQARTYRRFKKESLSDEVIKEFIEIASLSPSARNGQILRYITVNTEEFNDKMNKSIFMATLDYEKRQEFPNMQPMAYIILCAPKELSFFQTLDIGIAAQSIQLAAAEKNIGACMIGMFNKDKVKETFPILEEQKLEPYLVIALGFRDDSVKIVPRDETKGNYWREDDVHCVPKNTAEFNTLLKS